MITQKPYAISCDRNSEPILEVLKLYLNDKTHLLEVGAGTGQHSVFMAPYFPNLIWTLSDQKDNHEAIGIWKNDFPRANIKGPLSYKVGEDTFPDGEFDCIFTSNTLHMMSWDLGRRLIQESGQALSSGALIFIYGAFNYAGKFTSEGNERFEKWLKEKGPECGIRDFESVVQEMSQSKMALVKDHEMPANNRLLVFKKQ